MKKEIKIKEFKSGETKEKYDYVAVEKNIEMVLNGETRISLSISPLELKEFTYGFLFSSGFITSENHVKGLRISKEKIKVTIERKRDPKDILSLGSSGGRYIRSPSDQARKPFGSKLIPRHEKLLPLFAEFSGKSVIFAETGGVHSAALSDGLSIKFFSEDIGRHNAVDKVIGKALLAKIDFSCHFFMLSGRISSEIVQKCFHAGCPTIVSRSASTSLAVERARENNMSIFGFLRGNKFNIYT
jgi:FdhD protein